MTSPDSGLRLCRDTSIFSLRRMTINIAAYKFATLTDLKPLRERLLARCKEWNLKGTILLSLEGVNLFVAGGREEIELLLTELRGVPGLEELTPKYSESAGQPFTRMLVRIKKEIIAFGVEGINPALRTSPKLSAATLKQWLDEGRPVTLLDTRNDYEVKLGTFRNALIPGIDHFRQFPDAVSRLPEELKDQPVVMFCTGGIRCEKAGPYMEREGFRQIFQLEGGILKYFEECGADHYDGECFVFDQRVGVDPGLKETDSSQCFVCQTPLDAEDQRDVRYVALKSCPYCFKSPEEEMQARLAQRQEGIRRATTPLPGAKPSENLRPLNIPAACDGQPLIDCLSALFAHTPREEWLRLCEDGRFLDKDHQPMTAADIVRGGQRCFHKQPLASEPAINPDIRILHEDEAIIVIDKPAPLPMHPSGRFSRNSLQSILNTVYAPEKPRPAHRLDANTTGLVTCCRTRHFAKLLQPQFERGEVEKVYLVRVQGAPERDDFISEAPISAEPGDLGSRTTVAEGGLPARTEFSVLHRYADGTALLEARPKTGRTNQIRVHLWQLGWPVCGDPAYLPGGQLGNTQTLPVEAPPMMLHAWQLSFIHPVRHERVAFEAPRPRWAGLDTSGSLAGIES